MNNSYYVRQHNWFYKVDDTNLIRENFICNHSITVIGSNVSWWIPPSMMMQREQKCFKITSLPFGKIPLSSDVVFCRKIPLVEYISCIQTFLIEHKEKKVSFILWGRL